MIEHEAQLQAVAESACRLLVDAGPCDDADDYGDDAYCDDPKCSYCRLARAIVALDTARIAG